MALKESLIRSMKKAMQGELDSVTLYENAANHSSDSEVKNFFNSRRDEEKQHYNYLLKYYQELSNELEPSDLSPEFSAETGLNPIISGEFVKRIGSDQYLFSAISTALLLEKDAIEHYRKMEHETDNLTLKSFFGILTRWEEKHYEDLLSVQKEAEQYFWTINRFEPF